MLFNIYLISQKKMEAKSLSDKVLIYLVLCLRSVWLLFHFSLSRIGEGNGNPLQCSCLENPRDGGAWWATVYGVTQSRT